MSAPVLWFFIRTLSFAAKVTPSSVNAPLLEAVRTLPLLLAAKLETEAAFTASLISSACFTLST